MNIYETISSLAPLCEALTYFLIFEAFLERNQKFGINMRILGVLVLAALIGVCNHFLILTLLNIILVIGCAFLVSSVFYKGAGMKKLMAVAAVVAMSGVLETCSAHLVTVVLGLDLRQTLTTPVYRMIAIILSKATGLFIANIIRVKCQSRHIKIGKSYWLMFSLLFTTTTFAFFLIADLTYLYDNQIYTILSIICALGMFFSTFFSIYLYERLAKQSEEIRYTEQADLQLKSQIKHMDEIILKQNEIRKMRHDMNNQFVALKGYIDAGDFAGSARYLASLSDQLAQTSPAINTGNNALDAVLGAKQAVAEDRGIHFTSTLRIQENLPIAPEDLCVIFGNALDNAIEACDRLPEGCEKRISLTFLQDAHSLSCNIENTAAPNRPRTLATSKADKENHGFGLQNITETLAKYDSTPIITQSDNSFSLGFVIFLRR